MAISTFNSFWKRSFDIVLALTGLVLFTPLILLCWLIAAIETRSNGFFVQERVGRYAKRFYLYKIKTMRSSNGPRSHIAAHNTACITKSGKLFRKYKLDELPQLFNVLAGSMSFVGPRPDVPSYADQLQGEDRIILQLRPGITGPASIKYKDEEAILLSVDNPDWFNDHVIWPDKVRINREYVKNYSLVRDLTYIFTTIFGVREC
jgi:lipopolysaccharide/colanic/teichoic acid biosynthesis glycosyltransferase